MYHCIIIGTGPAGLTAGVYAARKNLSVLLIGKEYGGQVSLTSEIENYMGFQYISGPELIKKFEENIKEYPIERKRLTVNSINRESNHFTINCQNGEEYSAETVIIATGKSPRRLKVPGELKYTGRGISYCSVCDAPLFSGRRVAVIGGGNSALEAVNDLIQIAEHVYVISFEDWTADEILIRKAEKAGNLTRLTGWETTGIEGDDMVKSINIRPVDNSSGEEKLEVEGVFIEIGTIPNSDPVKGLLDLNENGEIIVDCSCKTPVPGIFAAGDITNIPEKQIIVAAGEGAKAALSAYKYLLNLEPEMPVTLHQNYSHNEESQVH